MAYNDETHEKYVKYREEFLKLWYKEDRTVTDMIRMNELEEELEKIEQEETK